MPLFIVFILLTLTLAFWTCTGCVVKHIQRRCAMCNIHNVHIWFFDEWHAACIFQLKRLFAWSVQFGWKFSGFFFFSFSVRALFYICALVVLHRYRYWYVVYNCIVSNFGYLMVIIQWNRMKMFHKKPDAGQFRKHYTSHVSIMKLLNYAIGKCSSQFHCFVSFFIASAYLLY